MSKNESFTFRVKKANKAKLKEIAERTGESMAELAEIALEEYLAKVEADGAIIKPLNQRPISSAEAKAMAVKEASSERAKKPKSSGR